MEHLNIVLISIVLLTSVLKTDALRCYNCAGGLNSDCARIPTESMSLETCSFSTDYCYYIFIRIGMRNEVSRGCSSTLCDANFSSDVEVRSCRKCWTNRCNVQDPIMDLRRLVEVPTGKNLFNTTGKN